MRPRYHFERMKGDWILRQTDLDYPDLPPRLIATQRTSARDYGYILETILTDMEDLRIELSETRAKLAESESACALLARYAEEQNLTTR